MPGPMSIPNGNGAEFVKVIVRYDDNGEPVYGRRALSALTGEQRAHLASRKKLDTGKTARRRNK